MDITQQELEDFVAEFELSKDKARARRALANNGVSIRRPRKPSVNKENYFFITCYTMDNKNNEVIAERRVSSMDDDGVVSYATKEMIFSAPTIQAAEALAIRKVYDHPYVHRAVYKANRLKDKAGNVMEFVVDRNMAVGHFLKRDKYRNFKRR